MTQLIQRPKTGGASAEGAAWTFLRVAGRLYGRVDRVLAPLDLSYPQYRALERLRDSGGWLADEPHEVQGRETARALVRSLELKRLVRVRADPGEAAVRVELTPAGSARALLARRRLGEVVGDFATSFSPGEALGFRRLLSHVESQSHGTSGGGPSRWR